MHPDDHYEQQRARVLPPPVPPGQRDHGALWRYYAQRKDGSWVLADDRLRYDKPNACAHKATERLMVPGHWRCTACGTAFLTIAALTEQRREYRRRHDVLRSNSRLRPLRVNWPLLWGHVGVDTFERMLAAGWAQAPRYTDLNTFVRGMK